MNLESGVSRHSEGTSTVIKTDNIPSALDSMLDILQTDKHVLYNNPVVEHEWLVLWCSSWMHVGMHLFAVCLMKNTKLDTSILYQKAIKCLRQILRDVSKAQRMLTLFYDVLLLLRNGNASSPLCRGETSTLHGVFTELFNNPPLSFFQPPSGKLVGSYLFR